MSDTDIEWTNKTWNPVRGCSRVSPGCDHCYAMGQAHRFSGRAVQDPSGDRGLDKPAGPYHGLTVLRPKTAKRPGVDWSGRVRFVPEMLGEPLRWRNPKRVFVNSMSDLFHESLDFADIAAVFGVMGRATHHTYQVLTKRPARAAAFFSWLSEQAAFKAAWVKEVNAAEGECGDAIGSRGSERAAAEAIAVNRYAEAAGVKPHHFYDQWPLPNVHLGVSAENQETYNERVPILVHKCPAAVHWVSLEPQLGPIELRGTGHIHLGWVVQGGESGPGARPFDIEWARSMRDECAESGIPYFLKQLGGNHFAPAKVQWVAGQKEGSVEAVFFNHKGIRSELATVFSNGVWHTWDARGIGGENSQEPTIERAKSAALEALQRQHVTPVKGWSRHVHMLRNRKGNDLSEWPEDLRIRQFPEARA